MGALVFTGPAAHNVGRYEDYSDNATRAGLPHLGVSRHQAAVECEKCGGESQDQICRGYHATNIDG